MAQKHKLQIILAPLLLPLSLLFGMAARLKALLFDLRIKKSHTPHIPCLCVGNISWGGTGKSPVIDYLLKFFRENSVQCAVLSRGYGTKLPEYPFLLDKNTIQRKVPLPDEPCMLIRKNPEAAAVISPKRAESAVYVQNHLPAAQVLLMDDGFQHFALARDFNLVLLDKDDLAPKTLRSRSTYSWNTLIPLGTWREPQSALHRASCFLLKCPPHQWQNIRTNTAETLRPFAKPLFVFDIRIKGLVPLFGGRPKPITAFSLLAGIGSPLQFKQSAEHFLGKTSSEDIFLKDHASMDAVLPKLLTLKTPLICTEKDAAKLTAFPQLQEKEIYFTDTELHFHAELFTNGTFENWLKKHILPQINKKRTP